MGHGCNYYKSKINVISSLHFQLPLILQADIQWRDDITRIINSIIITLINGNYQSIELLNRKFKVFWKI